MADVGTSENLKGYVTVLASCAGRSPSELERILGFSGGMLANGYKLYLLDDTIAPGEFQFRGYTHFSGGVPKGETRDVHAGLKDALGTHPVDQATWGNLLSAAAERLSRTGAQHTCKVVPLVRDGSYPPGAGVVQYELTVPKSFRLVAVVKPGQTFIRQASGEIVVRPTS